MSRRSRSNRRSRSRRNRRRTNRHRGGALMGAPVDYSTGSPMKLNLAQGVQYGEFHKGQHGGAFSGSAYPGAVTQSMLPSDLVASSRVGSTLASLDAVKGLTDPSPSNPMGGGRRRNRRSRKYRGGSGLVRWGGRRRSSRSNRSNRSRRNRSSRRSRSRSNRSSRSSRSRRYRGGAYQGSFDNAMSVSQSGNMLVSPSQQEAAGLNPEWKLAEDPMSFAPRS